MYFAFTDLIRFRVCVCVYIFKKKNYMMFIKLSTIGFNILLDICLYMN
jgi:hypothetical protein